MNVIKWFYLLCCVAFIFSCAKKTPVLNVSPITYLRISIKNPISKTATLKHWQDLNSKPEYLSVLDSNSVAEFVIQNINEGLYAFHYNSEFQTFYLEPGDSIVASFNAHDFDETFTYSGRGSYKNELLVTLYLENEKLYQFKQEAIDLGQSEFVRFLDSVYTQREILIDEFKLTKEHISSTLESTIVNNNMIGLNFLKEYYIQFNKIPKDSIDPKLIAHREAISLNDPFFYKTDFSAVFLHPFLENTILSPLQLKESHSQRNFRLMRYMDENLVETEMKSLLACQLIRTDFYEDSLYFVPKKNIELFKKIVGKRTSYYIDEVQNLLKTRTTFPIGTNFPNIKVIQKDTIGINRLFKNTFKKYVITFFSTDYDDYANGIYPRILNLKKQFPKCVFIMIDQQSSKNSINLDSDVDYTNYYLSSDRQLDSLLEKSHRRSIITNHNGIVINNYTNIYSNFIVNQLKE